MILLTTLLLAGAMQVHPCDTTTPTSGVVVVGTSYKVQFCAKPAEAPEAFTVYLNGVASELRPLTLISNTSASGYALYEGPRELSFPRGTHTLEVTVWNKQFQPNGPSQESPRSNPLALTAVDNLPRPTAPKLLGVVK